MSAENIVILDGTADGDQSMAPLLAMLRELLQHSGAIVSTFSLRNIRIAHCIGCFGCWIKTPGVCILADQGRDLARAVRRSDITILFTPVTFGGYSSTLKKCVDRWLPMILPFFYTKHGEIHHTNRYERYPRLIGIGIQEKADANEAAIFRMLVGRNAINFHGPYSADILVKGDPPDHQRALMQAILTRSDAVPFAAAVTSIMPTTSSAWQSSNMPAKGRRALVIIGSPKTKSPSTSAVLGRYLGNRLQERGWECDSLTLTASLLEKNASDFLEAAERAELLVLAFPLYIDSLPYLVTRALEMLAPRLAQGKRGEQAVVAICNNGFPEAHQSAPALAICSEFARRSGIAWAGGLSLGAGEALSSGDPLSARGTRRHPPTKHVMHALDLAADALQQGEPIPAEAQRLLEKCPLPFIPFSLWRWMFAKMGGRYWQQLAAPNGVGREALLARPDQ